MLGEEYLTKLTKSTPGSRRVTPSKTLPTEVKTPNSKRDKQFGGSVPRISMQTVHKVLTAEIHCSYLVIDCRYQYEFDGGHIVGAINCPPSDKFRLMEWLFGSEHGVMKSGPLVLIMHCEFSQCRAPRLASDVIRQYVANGINTGLEVYVMKGGYSEFHRAYPHLCDPLGYTPMHDLRNDSSEIPHSSSQFSTNAAAHRLSTLSDFDPEMFADRTSLSSQRNKRHSRRWRVSNAGTASLPSDSPSFFHTACSPMDYSPVGLVADLAKEFREEEHCIGLNGNHVGQQHLHITDDSSSGSSGAASRRGVYIHTEDDACDDDDEKDEVDSSLDSSAEAIVESSYTSDHIFPQPVSSHFLDSGSPSRSSSASSIYFQPLSKRRASMSAVQRLSDPGNVPATASAILYRQRPLYQ